MATPMKHIYFQFEGDPEIHQAEEWCFESRLNEIKYEFGIPIWTDHKIIQDYAPDQPHPELATYLSNVCDSPKPAVVHKPARKAKARPKTSDMSPMLVVLDDTSPVNMVQEVLRDRMGGSEPTIPNSMD
jgi:hypothetical protein